MMNKHLQNSWHTFTLRLRVSSPPHTYKCKIVFALSDFQSRSSVKTHFFSTEDFQKRANVDLLCYFDLHRMSGMCVNSTSKLTHHTLVESLGHWMFVHGVLSRNRPRPNCHGVINEFELLHPTSSASLEDTVMWSCMSNHAVPICIRLAGLVGE